MDEEVTKENIFDLLNNVYEQMILAFDDIEVTQIKNNAELMKRDASTNNLKICLDDLQHINNYLYNKYQDDNLIILLQRRINQCRFLFDLVDETELEDNGFVQ